MKKGLSFIIMICMTLNMVLPVSVYGSEFSDGSEESFISDDFESENLDVPDDVSADFEEEKSAETENEFSASVEESVSVEPALTEESNATRDIVLTLDCSGSMDGRMSALKEAARLFSKKVLSDSAESRISIVKINSHSSIAINFTNDMGIVDNAIEKLKASGGTDMTSAIKHASQLLDESPASEKDILIMSDGEPDSTNSALQAAESIKDKYKIYTVGFSASGSAEQFLKNVQNSGYYAASDMDALIKVFDKIADNILQPLTVLIDTQRVGYQVDENLVDEYEIYQIVAKVERKDEDSSIQYVSSELELEENGELIEGSKIQRKTLKAACGEDKNDSPFQWTVKIHANAYPDGGIYSFTVTTSSDKTLALSQKESIGISGINTDSNELNFWNDIWSFHNLTTSCKEKMSADDKNALLYGMDNTSYSWMLKYLDDDKTGSKGHCYGMSVSVILNKMNMFDISAFSGAKTLRQIKKEDADSIISYYQTMQFFSNVTEEDEYFQKLSVEKQLEVIANKADQVKNGGTPILLSWKGKEYTGELTDEGEKETAYVGHAVVAYALEPGTFKSSVTNKKYDHRILIYDPNSTIFDQNIFDEECCLLFNEGTDQWEIPAYVKKFGLVSPADLGKYPLSEFAKLTGCKTDLSVIDPKNYQASLNSFKSYLDCAQQTNYILEQYGKDTTDYKKRWFLDGNSPELPVSVEAAVCDGSSELPNIRTQLPDDSMEYVVKDSSGKSKDIDFSVMYPDKYLAVDSSNTCGVGFAPEGKMYLEGNEGDFTISVADNNVKSDAFGIYTVTGDSHNGDVTVEITDKGLNITSDKTLEGLIINATDQKTSDECTIQEDTDNITVNREDNKITTGEHVHNYTSSVVSPTCTEKGYTIYMCECGDSYTGNYVEALGHRNAEPVIENNVPATDQEEGHYDSVVYCSVCGTELSRTTYTVAIPTPEPIDISEMQVTLSKKTYSYDGKAKEPEVSIEGLEKEKDYTVAYENNIEAGEATVTITGVGNYVGNLTANFTIKDNITANKNYLNKKLKATVSASIKVTWGQVPTADGYDIFVSKCKGTSLNSMKNPTKTVKGNTRFSASVSKISGKKVSNTGDYKLMVKAYRNINGSKVYIGNSYQLHVVGSKNKKYTNPKSVSLNNKNIILTEKSTCKLNATVNKVNKNKKLLNHVSKVRYWSTNTKVAKVSSTGVVTAKKSGTCNIYMISENGAKTKVKITVK